ncbi:hypothetical protein BKA18_006938 [Streptomyces auratus]
MRPPERAHHAGPTEAPAVASAQTGPRLHCYLSVMKISRYPHVGE